MYRICGDKIGTTITMEENFKSDRKYKNFWHIFSHNKNIVQHGYVYLTDEDYEILYDLIKADLVEKGRCSYGRRMERYKTDTRVYIK